MHATTTEAPERRPEPSRSARPPAARPWAGARPATLALLDWDPSLGAGVADADRRALHERAVARLAELPAGTVSPPEAAGGGIGLLVIDGWLCRSFDVDGREGLDVVGPDDLIRPAVRFDAALPLLGETAPWRAMTVVRAAVLDEAFAERVAAWPWLSISLSDRLALRLRWHGLLSALRRVPSIDRRAHLALQALAERWGKVTFDGALVPVALTHRQLGLIIGARRSSTSSAVSRLTRKALIARRADRTWLVRRPPG